MSEPTVAVAEDDEDGPSLIGLLISVLAFAALGAFYAMGMTMAFYIAAVVAISIVIWQACDPFADAAQWIGTKMEIPGSVRGATLDAIASSMPELFTGVFFVVVALTGVEAAAAAAEHASTEGYGSAIATCAGSAVYNMIVIPACCAIFISFARPSRPTIDVEDEVIRRDGLWFLGCEALLLIYLWQDKLYAWMGYSFLIVYVAYVIHLFIDAKRYRRKLPVLKGKIDEMGTDADPEEVRKELLKEKVNVSRVLVMKLQDEIAEGENPLDEEEEPEDAGVFFGYASVPLSYATAWAIIAVCTAIAAGACYFLVEVTNGLAESFGVAPFFVAVIVAAAASSVPDTFLSIGAATRGDDDGAVSNAFGSNIFDICICLSIPLLLGIYQNGGQPLTLITESGSVVDGLEGLAGLRILLWILSLVTLLVIWHKRQLSRNKAFFLLAMYAGFVTYAILGARAEKKADAEQPPPAVTIMEPAPVEAAPLKVASWKVIG